MNRLELFNESIARVKKLQFGDPITNICAGDNNPRRHAYFVELHVSERKNKYCIVHKEYSVKCTDSKGKFWRTNPVVIYPGHISYKQARELYSVVRAVEDGSES